ncbi:MAG TPA: sulfite exporter TauE/SafE family protein, partial [Terriglobales bacterium]|nr:sulfite exporter TauE/SafE family protein [Terriglobales bacterium]
VIQDWKHVELRSALGLILSALPGIPVGVWVLARGSEHAVKLILGLLIVAFSIYSLLAKNKQQVAHDNSFWLVSCGFLSGVLGGAYGMNGPPLAVYGAFRRWAPQHFRATLQGYFLPASIAGLIGYAVLGLWQPPLTRYFLLCLPVVAVGIVLGRVINQQMSGQGFFRFVYAGLIVIGCVLVVQSF